MYSKLTSILTFVLILKLSESQTDFCKLILSDGKYKGMGIYNRFNLKNERTHVMYTEEKEWFFKITGGTPEVVLKDMEIRMIENSDKENPISKSVIRFGLYLKGHDLKVNLVQSFECYVINGQITKWLHTCSVQSSERGDYILPRVNFPDFDSFVTFKQYPAEYKYLKNGGNILIFNRTNKKEAISYELYDGKVSPSGVPTFVTQMDDWLFRQIEAVLDFNFDGNTGYLLLFNISGRPKYCFTSYGKDISTECKTPDKMKTLFEDCFQTRLTPKATTSTVRTTTENPFARNILYVTVILIIAVILLIIIVISGLYWVENRRKKRPIPAKTSSTPNTQGMTSISSVKTFQTKSSQSMIRPSDPNVKPKPK